MTVKSVSNLKMGYLYPPAVAMNHAKSLYLLKSRFDIKPKVVYVPGCGADGSHCEVFTNARRIINLDPEPDDIFRLRQYFANRPNIEFYVSRAQDFKLDEPIDLLVLFSCLFTMDEIKEELFDSVNEDGYIINNLDQKEFRTRSNFQLIGYVNREGNIIEGCLLNKHPITRRDYDQAFLYRKISKLQ